MSNKKVAPAKIPGKFTFKQKTIVEISTQA